MTYLPRRFPQPYDVFIDPRSLEISSYVSNDSSPHHIRDIYFFGKPSGLRLLVVPALLEGNLRAPVEALIGAQQE